MRSRFNRYTCYGLSLVLMVASTQLWAAKPGRGVVVIKSTVAQAAVKVDGRHVGNTPLKPLDLAPGPHEIRVRRLGYVEYNERILVAAAKRTVIYADLLPYSGVVRVQSSVPKAQVSIAGRPVGQAPLEAELGSGDTIVRVAAPGFEPFERVVNAAPGEIVDVKAQLKRVNGAKATAALDFDLPLTDIGATAGAAQEAAPAMPELEIPMEPLIVPPAKGPARTRVQTKPVAATNNPGPAVDFGLDALPELPALEPAAKSPTAAVATKAPAAADVPLLDLPLELGDPSGAPIAQAPLQGSPVQLNTKGASQPWYMQWWTWTAVGGVLITSVAVTLYMLNRDREPRSTGEPDVTWTPGVSKSDSLEAALWMPRMTSPSY